MQESCRERGEEVVRVVDMDDVRAIAEAWGHPSAKFAAAREAAGTVIEAVGRRGKYLIAALDDGRELIVHLGMTGQLRVHRAKDEVEDHTHVRFSLGDGKQELRFRDIRRFGAASLDLCAAAEGLVDAYFEKGLHPWDHAAGGLVARIAGARTELTRGVGGHDLMICAPAHGFDELRQAVREAGFLGENGSVSGE